MTTYDQINRHSELRNAPVGAWTDEELGQIRAARRTRIEKTKAAQKGETSERNERADGAVDFLRVLLGS